MKQLTLLLLFFLPLCTIAQEGTTLEEYRYLSKGYVYQLEMGLDADKDGYTIKNLFTASNGAKLVGLYKNGRSDTRAILVIVQEKNQKPVYICMPNKNADDRVVSLYDLDQKNLSRMKFKESYEKAMQEFLFAALNNDPNLQNEVVIDNKQITPTSFENNDHLSIKGDQSPNIISSPTFESSENVSPAPVKKGTSAKQSTSGDISGRNIVFAPEVMVASYKRGLIAVKVCVDKEGRVATAKFTQKGSTTFDRKLKLKAVDSARQYRFNESDVPEQCGIITFKF